MEEASDSAVLDRHAPRLPENGANECPEGVWTKSGKWRQRPLIHSHFWPSRRETTISTVMVLAFAFLAAIFFFLADQVMAYGVELILGIGR
jgi:preprotein translocase SecE subunit